MLSGIELYLDLMKKSVTDSIYGNNEPGVNPADSAFDHLIRFRGAPGGKWPSHAHTMIGMDRLNNLQACVEAILQDHVSGDLIETGVWRGGATIFMRSMLKAYGITDRTVWVADSFEGLPPPDPENYPADAGLDLSIYPKLAVSLETVQQNFSRYELLDDQVRFIKGWFRDTLPQAPLSKLALIRLDGDLYESTWVALESLYPKLSVGGYLIVDDYGAVDACQKAVHDFRERHRITEPIQTIDWTGVYWRRT
jgi:O-methyltransferase